MHKFPQDYPQPEKVPHSMEKHGDVRNDNYFWLRERENPKVIDYLNKENAYTAEVMKPVAGLEKTLFDELKSRVKEDESSVPYKKGSYYYYVRYETGKQYPIYARKKDSLAGTEEVLIDANELSKGHTFYKSSGPNISPNQEMMAFGADTVGRRFYSFSIKNLKTGQVLPDKIENITSNLVWAADNKTIFYTGQNAETLRDDAIYRYSLDTHKAEQIYFEKDETFSVQLYQSMTRKFIFMLSGATLTSEVRFIPADKPYDTFKIFTPRERGHEYSVTDSGDTFYILSNKNAKNFKLMTADTHHTEIKHWKELVPHRADVYLSDVTVFNNYFVLEEREKGLTQLHVQNRHDKQSYIVPFVDKSYLVGLGTNADFNSDVVRYEYESMRLPESVYDFNMKDHTQELKKVREVPNYNADLYKTERIFVTARDGAKIPVSLIMRKDHQNNGKAPMLVYGYGSYGANMDPWYSSSIFSLVDRGYVYALTHIRGGSEMGREWYDTGRTLHKKNTFTDFIDVTDDLVKNHYADSHRLYAMGGSAGGLLMGAVMNMRPELYHGVVAQVPFVDVITTMLDDTIPLTTGEYDEWGNPNEKQYYDYIKSYSPYDNVERKAYPNVLVTTGLHDSQVQYWEPAKWVAKLREYKTNSSVILLKTDMVAGHGGASGRFDQLKDTATEYAFILMVDENR